MSQHTDHLYQLNNLGEGECIMCGKRKGDGYFDDPDFDFLFDDEDEEDE